MKTGITILLAAVILAVTLVIGSHAAPTWAQVDATATPTGHAGHHGETVPSPTPIEANSTPASSGGMTDMSGIDMPGQMTATPMAPMGGMDMMGMMGDDTPMDCKTMMEHMMGMMGGDTPMDCMTMMEHMMGMGGMDMTESDSGMGHTMQPISAEGVFPAIHDQGGQPLEFRMEDGVKVFEIMAEPVLWKILDGVTVTAWTYNGTVPGPMIRVTEGDTVRVIFTNHLPEPTTIHWHGVEVPNAMDGIPGMTQDAVQPGETFTYEFVARPAGTYMYHSHFNSDTQVGLGLYAPFIIDPAVTEANPPDVDVTLMLSEWLVMDGQTYPAMPMAGMEPNYFTINGKAFPATETINVQAGQRVRLRFANIGQFVHPMHLHGMSFKVIATDGHPVPEAAQLTKDTISVAPGERYDIEFIATEPGQWMLHCHILHHTTNDGADSGGLMLVINVTG